MKRAGPTVVIKYLCMNCIHLKETKELDDASPVGDSLFSYFCNKSKKDIPYKGGFCIRMPDWCEYSSTPREVRKE